MSTSPPSGTSANDDERARWGDTLPDVGAAPRNDPNATEVPVRPPPPAPPPIYGRPPPPPAQPPPTQPSTSPTAPYPPVSPPYGGAPPPTPYPDPNAPTGYGGYPPQTPPGYGGTQPLPQPDAPPYYGGYPPQAGGYGTQPVYLPPAAPPPKKRGGLIAGIIAAVVAIVLIAAGVFFVTNQGRGTSATATPRLTVVSGVPAATATTTASARGVTAVPTQARIGNLQGTLAAAATGTSGAGASLGGAAATPTALAASAATPTRTAATATRAASGSASAATASRPAGSTTVGQGGLPPTPTGSARPGTAAATSSVTLGQTWTDPSGRLKLQYPNGWTVTKATNAQTNLVEIDSPDGASFFVDVDQMTGTPDEELQTTRDARASSNQYTFSFSPTTDTKIGGEAGKVFSYTAKQRNQPNSTSIDGILWVVNHGGEEYDFEVIATGRHRADIEAILATVVFL